MQVWYTLVQHATTVDCLLVLFTILILLRHALVGLKFVNQPSCSRNDAIEKVRERINYCRERACVRAYVLERSVRFLAFACTQ